MKNSNKKVLSIIAKIALIICCVFLYAFGILCIVFRNDYNFYRAFGWISPTACIGIAVAITVTVTKPKKQINNNGDKKTEPKDNTESNLNE